MFAPDDLVIEAATERWETERKCSAGFDRILAPEAILASNTSSISIDRLAAEDPRPSVSWNAFLQSRAGDDADRADPRRADFGRDLHPDEELAARLGKTAVEVRDAPGFVSNRVLMPLINEAAYAVMEGVATAGSCPTRSFAWGWRTPMGPLALADLIGLDVYQDILRVIEDGLGNPKFHPCPLLTRMVEEGRLGRK